MSTSGVGSGWESLAKAVRIQSEMKIDLLDCEELLTKRKFQAALDSAIGIVASLPASALETGGVRERALCVGIQALFELGRGEEAFSYTTNAYAPCYGSDAPYSFIPLGVLKLLFKLRLHLDDGDPERAEEILKPYILQLTSGDSSASAATTQVDEEALELYLLDCLHPKEGRAAVEQFLSDTTNSLPAQAHAGLSAGITAFFAEIDVPQQSSSPAKAKAAPSKAASDLDTSSRNPDDSEHASAGAHASSSHHGALPSPRKGAAVDSPRKHQLPTTAPAGGGGGGGRGQSQAVTSRAAVQSSLASHNPAASSAARTQTQRRKLLLWALGLGGVFSWLLLVIYAARRGRLHVLRRLLAGWKQAAHLWGPLIGAFAFIFAFVVVVL